MTAAPCHGLRAASAAAVNISNVEIEPGEISSNMMTNNSGMDKALDDKINDSATIKHSEIGMMDN